MSFGNRGGRPAKPKKLHILEGSFRKDRHGAKGDAPSVAGDVIVPDLEEHAKKMWGEVIGPLVKLGIVTSADVPAAQAMCESWGLMRRSFAALESDPCDKLARTAYTAYCQLFDKFASRFGLTPADRQRLKFEKPPEKSAFQKFLDKKSS